MIAPTRDGTNRPLRLLLLEDSARDAQLITATLHEANVPCELLRVDSRDAFLAGLAQPVDLILSDFKLPGFDGAEALALAAERAPQVPFIFVSGAIGEVTAVELLQRGATDYVLKQSLERLAPSVQRALREQEEILERKRAEEALRERERTLSTLIANLPGMAFRREHRRPWRMLFASEGAAALCGHSTHRFASAGVTWTSVVHPQDLERYAAEAEEAFSAGRQLTTTYRIRTRDGEERWVWERSIAQRGADGAVETVEGFATDITQQKAAESEIRQRVEFEQQLIGIVSHDLRNPLNTITLGAALLLKREGLNEANTSSVRRILSSAERAGRMIRDLLDYTQVRLGGGIPISPRHADLGEIVQQVVEEFEHGAAGRRIEVEIAPDQSCCGEWDPDRVAQALGNLLGNALSYSSPGTAVTLRISGDEQHVCVDVHNDGSPIPADRIPHLFKPLSRGTRELGFQTRSIGLGLFIVEGIVRAHQGTVSVRSTEAEGTTFTVRLPRHPQGVVA